MKMSQSKQRRRPLVEMLERVTGRKAILFASPKEPYMVPGEPSGIMVAIKVQGIARQVFYNWGNQVAKGWDTSDWTGPEGQTNLKGPPSIRVGAGNLYSACFAQNNSYWAGDLTLTIVDDTGKELASKTAYVRPRGLVGVPPEEGIGVETASLTMPNRSYGITIKLTPGETVDFTIQPLEVAVCANNPQLRRVYERAQSLGLTGVAKRIARACEMLGRA